jgi:hypothetical protein
MRILRRARGPLLLLIMLLAFSLRVHQVEGMGFWLDEGLTPLRSGYSIPEILSNRITIQDGVTRDTHPPLYYLLIHLSRAGFGESDLAYRFPSVLAGLLLIPILYQLARRIDDENVALVAALLAAVNPLQIWYAQEARMYTLVTLLAAIATWALWRALTGQHLFRWLALYLLFSGLAFYTHYTTLFVMGAQAVFWVWVLWRKGHRRLLVGFAALGVLIVLPLLPMIIPRLFTGAEANYSYVPPWIMLQDVVHGFGLGLTVDFSRLGIKLLDVASLLILLAGLVRVQKSGRHELLGRVFLLTYLLAAVLGLSLGSLIKPMYMGARHIMIGSPAFLLLLARGLFSLGSWGDKNASLRRWRLAPLLGALALAVGPVISLGNLYHDPWYAKDDIRALIRHVEQRAGDSDLLLYNNAIHLPIHWHYQQRQDLAATALPVYPHPAGPDTEEALRELSTQFERIWFIGDLPGDGRDDSGVVRNWIGSHLVAGESYSAHGRNLEVRVTAFSAAPRLTEQLPPDGIPLDVEEDGLPTLRGLRLGFEQPAAVPTLWIDLYWQGGKPPSPDWQLRFALQGPDGNYWLDYSQSFWDETASSWPQESLVRLAYGVPVPAGSPPGDYQLLMSIWDKVGGQTIADWRTLTPVALADSSKWPLDAKISLSTHSAIRFANGLNLLGLSWVTNEVKPGHPLPLSLYWSAELPPVDVRYQLDLVGPGDKILRTQEAVPGADWLTPDTWPLETLVREDTGLYFPPDTPPGRYQLRWSVSDANGSVGGRPAWRPWNSQYVTLGSVTVRPWPLETSLPELSHLLLAEFGSSIELGGYQMAEELPGRGEVLDLTLYWRARQVPGSSYHVFVHLVRADDGTIVSQLDRIPVDWLRPTNGWREGEVLTDRYLLPIPSDLTPGSYQLYVGLYEPDTWLRLPITYQGERQPDDQLLLTMLDYE